ncbi:hypothetical protein EVAR_17959_1 [Eumeta japonica]|uniref:FLYWCH-type domain-containing protein n=1 Tax=Eumeta variegata TaxID=151549 RepID=A0A4C1UZ08_EUMVA|nr:hypothetical protein EVAR_17959_1 [Eumeta japonica]
MTFSSSIPSSRISSPYNAVRPLSGPGARAASLDTRLPLPAAVYVPSRTGKSLLLHEGYTFYLKNVQAHGRKQWYCSSRDMAGCRADVITAPGVRGGDVLFLVRGKHIHAPPSYYFTPDGKYVRRKDVYHRVPSKSSTAWWRPPGGRGRAEAAGARRAGTCARRAAGGALIDSAPRSRRVSPAASRLLLSSPPTRAHEVRGFATHNSSAVRRRRRAGVDPQADPREARRQRRARPDLRPRRRPARPVHLLSAATFNKMPVVSSSRVLLITNIWLAPDCRLTVEGPRFLATARGGRLLLYQGNTYFVNSRRRSRARVLWYCSSRKSRHCPASIFTMYDKVLGQAPAHTHPPKVSTYATLDYGNPPWSR